MSQPSPDARAVVRAVDNLTTQVRRIADALSTPVTDTDDAPRTTAVDEATTPATTCSARYNGTDPMRWCIRAAHHREQHTDSSGWSWPDLQAVYPLADGVVKQWVPPVRRPPMDPVHILGIDPSTPEGVAVQPAPAAEEDTPYLLRVLADRAARGALSLPGEGEALRRRVEQFINGRATWKAKAEEIERDRDRLTAELEDAEQRADGFRAELEQAQARAEQADAVTAETKRLLERRTNTLRERAEQAEAALTRVRAECADIERGSWTGSAIARRVRRALDGTEQPTTEQPSTCTATIPDALGSAALHRCVAPAGHYDETDQPVYTGDDRSPGGWHTDGEGHVWSDRAAAATPHTEQTTTD
ncbi:hypothetical protein ACWZEH_12890 [Streptomyces sp. QTS137]